MKVENLRFALFFEKSGNLIRLGQFIRKPPSGGWCLGDELVVAPLSQFLANPRSAIENYSKSGAEFSREKASVNRAFLAKHDEITLILAETGDMSLIPMRRLANGVSATQAAIAPIQVHSKSDEKVFRECILLALAEIRETKDVRS